MNYAWCLLSGIQPCLCCHHTCSAGDGEPVMEIIENSRGYDRYTERIEGETENTVMIQEQRCTMCVTAGKDKIFKGWVYSSISHNHTKWLLYSYKNAGPGVRKWNVFQLIMKVLYLQRVGRSSYPAIELNENKYVFKRNTTYFHEKQQHSIAEILTIKFTLCIKWHHTSSAS